MHVLIDDIRDVGSDLIIRNPYQAITALKSLDGLVTELSVDNDMGDGPEGKHILEKALQIMTLPPAVVTIVTSNPVAAQHMRQSLEKAGYTTIDRFTYRKPS